MKFREFDEQGVVKPNEEFDQILKQGESYEYYKGKFESNYEEQTPAHVRENRKCIMPSG